MPEMPGSAEAKYNFGRTDLRLMKAADRSAANLSRRSRAIMEDMQAQLAKLREQAAELDRIASRATDPAKRELFSRLAEHKEVLRKSGK